MSTGAVYRSLWSLQIWKAIYGGNQDKTAYPWNNTYSSTASSDSCFSDGVGIYRSWNDFCGCRRQVAYPTVRVVVYHILLLLGRSSPLVIDITPPDCEHANVLCLPYTSMTKSIVYVRKRMSASKLNGRLDAGCVAYESWIAYRFVDSSGYH